MVKKEDNKIGLIGATSYIVGSIIGSGIFIAPKGIVEHAGSVGLSLIIWVFCALLNMITAIVSVNFSSSILTFWFLSGCLSICDRKAFQNYIELGTSIPESGADLAYIGYMGWTPIAFSLLWLSLLIQSSSSAAVLYLTFGKYIVQALDPIICFSPADADNASKLFGFGLLCEFQRLHKPPPETMSFRVYSFLIIIIFFLISISHADQHVFTEQIRIKSSNYINVLQDFCNFDYHRNRSSQIMKGSDWKPGAIVLAIYQGNWAFGGFTTLNYGSEEIQIENFRKTLPRACLGGLVISAVIYVLTFIQRTVGNGAAFAVPAVVGFLLIGTLNGDVFSWSRYMVAGSRRKMMPTCFSLIHVDNDSPRVSVFFHTFTSIIFAFLGDTDQLVDYLNVVGMLTTIFALAVLVIIKWRKMPVAADPVKYSIFWPVLNIIIMIALLVIPIQQDPISSIIGFSMFLGGVVVYFVIKFIVNNTEFLGVVDRKLTHLCQILTWTVVDLGPEEKTHL
ncbi:hypothetical protein CRE_16549 [Caenorhabditis remanei]|uniref:Uncharacterized protein n=1 Tax=Caenorhabditis remanei TaxID=31234 RepID=E3NS89_CAERE|nr:hypothetical protein CRE_16549 [Caenorhabditis remanei]